MFVLGVSTRLYITVSLYFHPGILSLLHTSAKCQENGWAERREILQRSSRLNLRCCVQYYNFCLKKYLSNFIFIFVSPAYKL